MKESYKAGGAFGAGALAGLIKGGGVGVAAFGGAVGVPLWFVGGLAGLAGYGVYKAFTGNNKHK